jgi:hypothetical protein
MINAVSNATQAEPVYQSAGTSTSSQTQPDPKSTSAVDSVQLSKATQATLAVLQEAQETPTQTAKEAGHGDLQAQHLLAKEAAAKSVA